MKKFKILLNSPDDVQEFVKIASQCPYDIDLEHGSVYIDAKSFLGVLTMELIERWMLFAVQMMKSSFHL